jgi:hypothetical protein
MAGQITIASVRAHGVRQLLVYCLRKREGDCRLSFKNERPPFGGLVTLINLSGSQPLTRTTLARLTGH